MAPGNGWGFTYVLGGAFSQVSALRLRFVVGLAWVFPSGGSSPDGLVSGMAAGRARGWVGKDWCPGCACHPVDLPEGYHTASRGPGGLGTGLVWASGPLDPV
ncbi:hypothetical protein JCM33774_39180 [Actinophytocola sp. KF-1]